MAKLPAQLPDNVQFDWKVQLASEGIGGIAATSKHVIVGSRSVLNDGDMFTCHDARTGREIWRVDYPVNGELDYGNSPRATPLIVKDRVVLLGAFGNLTVVSLKTGEIVWQTEFKLDFDAETPIWGFCGSPICVQANVDGKSTDLIVVQPGAKDASLVGYDLLDGGIVWESPGRSAGYGSLIEVEVHGENQLVGFDAENLNGWNLQGRELWSIPPLSKGDFNVPTPIAMGNRIFVTSENNGSRIYRYGKDRQIKSAAQTHSDILAPDTHTPVLTRDFVCGIHGSLICLDRQNLKLIHEVQDDAFLEYAALVSDGKDRLLVFSQTGAMVLVQASRDKCRILDRLQLPIQGTTLAHPALVGNRLYVRLGRDLACLQLD